MKFKIIIIPIIFFLITGCEQYTLNKSSEVDFKPEKKYKNSGFALIYNNDLNLKKLDQRSLQAFHKTLKAKSLSLIHI